MAKDPIPQRPTSKKVGNLAGLWPFIRPYRPMAIAAGLALVSTSMVSLVLPMAVRRVIDSFGDGASLVECWLETGRTHQIRVHMAYAGHELLGDQTYGGKRKLSPKTFGAGADFGNDFPRQALHAASLGFEHPVTGEWMEFTSDLPDDMARLIQVITPA